LRNQQKASRNDQKFQAGEIKLEFHRLTRRKKDEKDLALERLAKNISGWCPRSRLAMAVNHRENCLWIWDSQKPWFVPPTSATFLNPGCSISIFE
jgi:hypothetical protein